MINPLYDRVAVERFAAEEKTISGIVLPSMAAERPDMGVVIAVGNGRLLDNGDIAPLYVKVGDKVIFKKYTGQTVKLDDKELLVMREDDILAVVV